MKTTITLLLLLVTTQAVAQGHDRFEGISLPPELEHLHHRHQRPVVRQTAPTHRLKNGLQVYESVVYDRLPDFVYDMTDDQWFDWATDYNKRARRANREAAFAQTGHTRYATETQSEGWSQTRFGGGVGAGGYGGNGGYTGYLDSGQQGGGGGYQYGAGRPGNSMQTRSGSASRSYNLEFPPWPVWSGGDVVLLNPYAKPKRPK